ncbi:putative ribonuclease H-like domain-containing protein [Tanacetum coccineum]|uniref:Ribonuclease H-like domain-containing protein n=1 Tax=Tanacetum coccineum TaxID=301880 RepID=A0ABQ5BVG0_9ASTR
MSGSQDETPPPPSSSSQTPLMQKRCGMPSNPDLVEMTNQRRFRSVSTKDANQKFLRSLLSAWSQVSLIMRTKPGVDSLSFDDLYNNLRVLENNVKGSTASSSSMQNVAFVSKNTSSTNDVSTTYSVSNTSGQNLQYEQTSSYSLLANQSSCLQLDHEDLEQLDEFDLEKIDLKWQVVMISMRMKKFYKKTGRKLQFDAKEPVGFDKTKVECYNCHKTGHFARECRTKGNQDSRRRDAWNSGNKVGEYLAQTQREQLSDASIEIKAYTQGLKKVEAQLVAHQQGQLWYEEKIRFMKIDLDDKTDVLTYHKKLLAEAQKEKEDLKAKVEKWHNSSKNLGKLLNTQMSANDKFGLGYGDHRYDGILSYENEVLQSVFMNKESELEKQPLYDRFVTAGGMHDVPPPMTGNYMPSGPDVEIDYSQFTYGPNQSQPSESETQTSDFDTYESDYSVETHESFPEPTVNEPKVVNQSKVWSDAPIIEEYESDSEDEHMETVKNQFTHSKNPTVDKKGLGYGFTARACFVCGSLSHLIRDCDFHEKRMAKQAELTNSAVGEKRETVVKPSAGCNWRTQRHNWHNVSKYNGGSSLRNCFTFKDPLGRLKPTQAWVPKRIKSLLIDVQDYPHKALQNKGIVDSGCSRHMTGNKALLAEYHVFYGGPVAFGGVKRTKDETSEILKDFIRQIENQLNQKVKTIRCDNGTEFKNKDVIEFCGSKGIKREYSNARTPQQNGVAERKNRTLIEAARTMLFDGKSDEGFLVGYSLQSKAFRVYNLETKRVEENLHITFLENKPNVAGKGPTWLFDLDYLTDSMNYQPVRSENQANKHAGPPEANQNAGTEDSIDAGDSKKEDESAKDYFCTANMVLSYFMRSIDKEDQVFLDELERLKGQEKDANDAAEAPKKEFAQETENLLIQVGAAKASRTNIVNIVSTPVSTASPYDGLSLSDPTNPEQDDSEIPALEDIYQNPTDGIFTNSSYDDEGAVVDFTNLESVVNVSHIPTSRIHFINSSTLILGDPKSAVQTRSKVSKSSGAHAFVSYVQKQRRNNHKDFQHCLFACFLSQNEPKKISEALEDESWVDAMQEELLQFKIQKVWILVDLPYGKKAIGTKWVYRNKKDERGVVVRNKARLVAQGHRQEEGIDYDEVFAPMARIEAIRIFLAFASYMGFIVYQMDVKSAFLYGKIDEEVYVSQPPGFLDPKYPQKVYKVVKALYGLHQAPRAWYATLSTFLLKNGYRRGTIDKTLFLKKDKHDIILVQVYVDDIIFGSTKKSWCDEFEALMKSRFQMSSMGELTFFLGLQTASIPIETHKPLVKDKEASDVDVHLYRSMIGSLMYLTASRPDIMFAVCACSRFQVTPKTSHLSAVKRIFRYLKGKPKLGLEYPRVSSFDLEAYSDSDYTGANLDRKSIIGGCQFLGRRLIFWQCKKHTIVATSTKEAEYVATASCCGHNPVYHSKTNHIAIRHHFIRDAYEKKLIQMLKIHTDDNVADLLTKAFDSSGGTWEVGKSAKAEPSVHKDPLFDELADDNIGLYGD